MRATRSEPLSVSINDAHVVHERIDDEVIVVNMDTGTYYGLREVGAEIWALLGRNTSTDAIVDALVRRYSGARDAVAAAVQRFLAELAAEALVVLAPASAGLAAEGVSLTGLPFEFPSFEKFTDLRHLIVS